ncbi:MAG: DUF4159 domain-containing protein [Candidatus Poribacteria bacterium]|nr:DUF4159 domain-containing protein [Candidatus Poribacteria bacterium]
MCEPINLLANSPIRAFPCLFLLFILILCLVAPASSFANGPSDSDLFTFVRLRYTGTRWFGNGWEVDWPTADRNFISHLRQATNIPVSPREKIISVGSSELFAYPFAYMLEVGTLKLTDAEAENLREYLLRGGFIMIDDFHGGREWRNFHRQFKKIFPNREPEDIPISHPLFHCFFDIDKLIQIPGLRSWFSGRTYERYDGHPAYCRGVYDDHGRLMMMINFNTDLGDAWEHAAEDFYPRKYSDMAYQMGINAVIYALTH